VGRQLRDSAALPLGKESRSTHWIGGPRTGLDDVEKRKFLTLPGLELRPLGRPAWIAQPHIYLSNITKEHLVDSA
jgi:hypothetical protein